MLIMLRMRAISMERLGYITKPRAHNVEAFRVLTVYAGLPIEPNSIRRHFPTSLS